MKVQVLNFNSLTITEQFRTKMATLNLYFTNKKIPNKLTEKIRSYYKHLWSRQVPTVGSIDVTKGGY